MCEPSTDHRGQFHRQIQVSNVLELKKQFSHEETILNAVFSTWILNLRNSKGQDEKTNCIPTLYTL